MLPPKIPETIRSFLQSYLPTGTFSAFELLWSRERLEARLTRKAPSTAATLRKLARALER